MSALRELLAQGSFLVQTEWPGRGVVLGTRITLGGDVLVAVSPGFAAAPDGAAIELHRKRLRDALQEVRRAQRGIRVAGWCVAATPAALAAAGTGLSGEALGPAAYAVGAATTLGAALLWRRARAFGLRLAWWLAVRRVFSGG
jgi:hypothetical protein